jgi:hypothetical protein
MATKRDRPLSTSEPLDVNVIIVLPPGVVRVPSVDVDEPARRNTPRSTRHQPLADKGCSTPIAKDSRTIKRVPEFGLKNADATSSILINL